MSQRQPSRGGDRHPWSAEERALLGAVDQALEDAVRLYRWWLAAEKNNQLQRIPVARQPNSTESNYGFLEEVALSRGVVPVLGVIQEMFFDRPKTTGTGLEQSGAEWYRSQVQEFVLRYFLRVSSFVKPQIVWQNPQRPQSEGRLGLKYQQLLYKLAATGEVGRFGAEERPRILDLRRIGKDYEWVIFHGQFFDFTMRIDLVGVNGPRLVMPAKEEAFTAINRDLVFNVENPEPGVLGEYGFGIAIIPSPSSQDSVLAFGPSAIVTGLEIFSFRVLETGEVRAKVIFVVNKPTRILKFQPVEWSFQLADLMSFGLTSRFLAPIRDSLSRVPLPKMAPLLSAIGLANSASGGMMERQLCISERRLFTDIMVLHFLSMYQLVLQMLLTWEQVPDWLDEKNLPDWTSGVVAAPSPHGPSRVAPGTR